MITSMPVDDPLLSRISVDPSSLPLENRAGWRLRPDVQQSWKRLEQGLWLISDLLFDALGNPLSAAIRSHESWDRPQDFAYLQTFGSEYAVRGATRRAHKAFLFLAARCSLAVACYETAHNPRGTAITPPWLALLTKHSIPPCWLDALHRSVITQFARGTRVGVVVNLSHCPWPQLIPVILHARVPIYLYWEHEGIVRQALSTYQFAQLLVPHRADWERILLSGPPACTREGVYHLYRQGQLRIHPDNTDDPSRPPHGPYQRPGERLEDFLKRQKINQDRRRNAEDAEQRERRERRESHATSGLPPGPRTRVYVWMRLGDARPEAPLLWHNKPYRMPVASTAVRGLWAVQPPEQRCYNSFVDEWDMWLPPSGWLDRHERHDTSSTEVDASAHDEQHTTPSIPPQASLQMETPLLGSDTITATPQPRRTTDNDVRNLQDDLRSLYPAATDCAQRIFIRFRTNFVHEWYGFCPPYTPNTEVPKPSVFKYMHVILGIVEKDHRLERDERTALAACITAVLARNDNSDLLQRCWDLKASTSRSLVHNRRYLQSCTEASQDGRPHFLVKFAKDATSLAWTLALSPSALVFLLRRGNIIDSHSAARELLLCGVSFGTVTLRHTTQTLNIPPPKMHLLDCRIDGYAAGIQDYTAYVTRLLELLQHPHARAGLTKGGIVWRLLVEAVGHDKDVREHFLARAQGGPSGEAYVESVFNAEDGEYVDDDLSRVDLDIICGTYIMFTGTQIIRNT